MALLAIIYWVGAAAFLIDRSILDITPARRSRSASR
jgi:uncharacterized membrane protein